MLSQWKLFDNLRRSLVPAALTMLLLLGWTVLAPAWLWTEMVIGILLAPSIIAALSDLVDKPDDLRFRQHLAAVETAARRHAWQALLALAFLPYETYFCLDAIIRTLGRTLFTRRRLLEWNPSSDAERALEQRGRTTLRASYRAMVVAPALAATAWVGLAFAHPAALPVAGPILLLWCASPAIAWWFSRPLVRRSSRLTLDQLRFLRKLSRRTWAYFETHVGTDDRWLPPDNVQVSPPVGVAHRTSPTNMGLALLANLAAHDFGYLSTGKLVERTANAFGTMASLEKHRGHFYNWYDTQTLLPLAPLYVSTVDSGNLAGHLLTLRPGLAKLADAAILKRRWLEGVQDAYAILVETLAKEATADAAQIAPFAEFAQFDAALARAFAAGAVPLPSAWVHVDRLAAYAAQITAQFTAESAAGLQGDARFWAEALARQCADTRDDLRFLAPWLELPTEAGAGSVLTGAGTIPTLR